MTEKQADMAVKSFFLIIGTGLALYASYNLWGVDGFLLTLGLWCLIGHTINELRPK